MDPLSSASDTSAPLVGSPEGTEEVDFEPLHASDAAMRLGGSGTLPAGAAAATGGGGGGGSQQEGQGQPPNRQGSLFERIQAAQAAQLGGSKSGQEILPAAAPGGSSGMSVEHDDVPPFAQPPAAAADGSGPNNNPFGGADDDDDEGPTLYASAPSVPQYQPVSSGPDPYGDPNAPAFPTGASAGEKAAAVMGAVWEATTKYGGRAARAGYRGATSLVEKARNGGGAVAGGGEGGTSGLLGGGGNDGGMDVESGGMGGGGGGGGGPSFGQDQGGAAAAAGPTMEGFGGGGGREEQYSMIGYARMFCGDVWGCVSSAPTAVQYVLILVACWLFWVIFK